MAYSIVQNTGLHIARVIENACGKHNVPAGVPCYHIKPGTVRSESYFPGVCGRRILKAGFNGKISQASLSLKTSGGRASGRKR